MSEKKKSHGCLGFVFKVLLILAVVFSVVKLYPVFREYYDASVCDKNFEFEIMENWTGTDVAEYLAQNDVIKSKWSFILKQKFNEEYKIVYSGIKNIKKGDSLTDIMKEVTTMPEAEPFVTITIPEGFSAEMIGLRCQNNGLCTQEEFLEALNDEYNYEFIKYIPEGDYKYKLQGFLFPNTYEFAEDVTAHDIVDTMLAFFQNMYGNNYSSYENIFDIVTVASLIEREAKIDSERATISGVIYNRLENGMPLQIDASAVYAKSNGMYDISNVNAEVVAVDSVYNTYKVTGLPVGPICCPGFKSVEAAVNPEEHNYLYYHTDEAKGDGSHIFTESYSEHVSTMN